MSRRGEQGGVTDAIQKRLDVRLTGRFLLLGGALLCGPGFVPCVAQGDQALFLRLDDADEPLFFCDHSLGKCVGIVTRSFAGLFDVRALGTDGHGSGMHLVASGLVGNRGDVLVLGCEVLQMDFEGGGAQRNSSALNDG